MLLGLSLILLAGISGFIIKEVANKDHLQSAIERVENDEQKALFDDSKLDIEYKNVGGFIAFNHEWYNQTLGWGGINSVKWNDQQLRAIEISQAIETIHTDIEELNNDFEEIKRLADMVKDGNESQDVIIKLHRYFHDLDIEYNQYKQTKDYYNITQYKNK